MSAGKPRIPQIEDDPIGAAERLAADIGGSRRRLYAQLAEAYEIATVLNDDEELLATFRAHSFWKKAKPSKHTLRAVMCFVFQAQVTSGPAYERACNYTVALESEWVASVPASHIVNVIDEAGGIEELYALGKARRAAAKNKAGTDTSPGQTNGEDGVEEQPPAQPRATKDGEVVTQSENDTKPPKVRKYSREWCEKRFVSEMPDEDLLKLVLHLPERGSVMVKITKMGIDDDGFKVFTASRA